MAVTDLVSWLDPVWISRASTTCFTVAILTTLHFFVPLSLVCRILFVTTATSLVFDLLALSYIVDQKAAITETTIAISTLLQEKRTLETQLQSATLRAKDSRAQGPAETKNHKSTEGERAPRTKKPIGNNLSKYASRSDCGEDEKSVPVIVAQPRQHRKLHHSTSACIITAKNEGAALLDRNIKCLRDQMTQEVQSIPVRASAASAASDSRLLKGAGKKFIDGENESDVLRRRVSGDMAIWEKNTELKETMVESIIRERVFEAVELAFEVCREEGKFKFELRKSSMLDDDRKGTTGDSVSNQKQANGE